MMAESKCSFCTRKTKYRCVVCVNAVCVVCSIECDINDERYDEERHRVGMCPTGLCLPKDDSAKDVRKNDGKSKTEPKRKTSGKKDLFSYFPKPVDLPSISEEKKKEEEEEKKKKEEEKGKNRGVDDTDSGVCNHEINIRETISTRDDARVKVAPTNVSCLINSTSNPKRPIDDKSASSVIPEKKKPKTPETSDAELKDKILAHFRKIFPNLDPATVHNYYFCRDENCTEICKKDLKTMTKDKKFQHKWLFDPAFAYCNESKVWNLVYIEGKGMFCALCREFDAKQKQNGNKEWNSIPNVRYRTETVRGHLKHDTHLTSLHSLNLRKTSFFDAEQEKKVTKLKNGVYFKVFQALYWLAKEEIPFKKCTSLLKLIERFGVADVKYFETRSEPVLRKMLLLIARTIIDDVVEKIKESNVYGFLTDEVTDIANICQLVSFVKYFDKDKGKSDTVFIDVSDLLSYSETSSPDAESIVKCVEKRFEELTMDITKLVAFVSDGASVMTGTSGGVAALLRKKFTPTMINVHCICHRLALACGDTGDDFKFVQNVEENLLLLWSFFKNSSKRLAIYMKIALKTKSFATMTKKRKKTIVKRMKKACRTRWLSLHAGVDAAWEEYGGLIDALKFLAEDRKTGSVAKGILNKVDDIEFLGSLCLFKNMLPILSTLSKTFQTNSLNFSRITPAINKSKAKIMDIANDGRVIQQLEGELEGRFKGRGITLTDFHKQRIESNVVKYANAICKNIDARFPKNTCEVLSSFSIFDIELFPNTSSSAAFKVHGLDEVAVLAKQFFPTISVEKIRDQWEDFKYELVEIKKKYHALIKNIEANKLKFKKTPSEWTIEHIINAGQYDDEYSFIVEFAKIAGITPVTNAWPERGASAVKRIKSRLRSTMNNDMLNGLIHISMNGPPVNTKEADELIERVVDKFIQEKHYKVPNSYAKPSTATSTSSTQTMNITPIDSGDDEIDILPLIDADIYLASHFEVEEDEEEDDGEGGSEEEDGEPEEVEEVGEGKEVEEEEVEEEEWE